MLLLSLIELLWALMVFRETKIVLEIIEIIMLQIEVDNTLWDLQNFFISY